MSLDSGSLLQKETKKILIQFAVLFLLLIIWFWAGYSIGYTKGRGWRAAVLSNGCELVCPNAEEPTPKWKI